MMSFKLLILITIGVYVFVTLLIYFIMCLITGDGDEDNIGLAICWPFLLIGGIICAPFWVIRKSAKCIRRGMGIEGEEEE